MVRTGWAPPLPAQTTPSAVQNKVAPAGGSVDVATATGPAIPRRRAPERVKGPTPHLADGTVDLSGVWQGGGPVGDIAQGMPKGAVIPMTPAAERRSSSRRQSKDDPEANCLLPTSAPCASPPYPLENRTNPHGVVFFLFEGNIHSFHGIFVDGRKHPDDPDPTWYGHSIGHYDGDTLVVDTVGFNDKFWFDFGGPSAHRATPYRGTLNHHRTDLGTMVVETDINDPGVGQSPFTISFTFSTCGPRKN